MLVTAIFLLAGLLALLLLVNYFFEAHRDRTRERLLAGVNQTEEEEVSLWADAADLLQITAIQRVLEESILARRFAHLLKKSGLRLTLTQAFLLTLLITAICAGAAYGVTGMGVAAAAALLLAPLLTWFLLTQLAAWRTRKHDSQLPALISQLITTLRSGGTPIQAMQSAAQNAPSPVRESMADLLHTIQIGVPAIQAWREWAQFWDTRATQMLALGVRLKWEAGGQMTAILSHIQESLEFHRRMELRVLTITAQARLSAYILTALPFVIGLMTYSIRPTLFEQMIDDEFGRKALIFTGALMVVGFIWLRKIAKLEN